jgi:cytochrome c oxidase subunit 2
MRANRVQRRAPTLIAASILALGSAGCSSSSPSILSPKGTSEAKVDGLWWLLFWVSIAVFLVVVVLMAAAIVRRRRREEPTKAEPRWGEPFVVIAGIVVPALILATVFFISLNDLNSITDSGNDPALTVQVIGHMWWWEVRYPNGAVTANEIHIPVGQPVRFEVTSADVIHSFWVPQLGPKIDMIPGRTNFTTLEATTPGRYRGQCAEFCGLEHANMALFVIAEPASTFDSWMRQQALPAAAPTGEAARGLQVFESTCAGCHTIRGTTATGVVGPDLTHLASRQTIAAGTLVNDQQNLDLWITDPQSVKPGAVMPPTNLDPADLRALVDYLRGLR